jgi:hypothetical protein
MERVAGSQSRSAVAWERKERRTASRAATAAVGQEGMAREWTWWRCGESRERVIGSGRPGTEKGAPEKKARLGVK